MSIQTVGIISKPEAPQAITLVPQLLAWFAQRGIAVRMDQPTAEYAGLPDGLPREAVAVGTQLLIVLGGDGTLLSAARALLGNDLPILAVNLGGLGFLTAITVEEVFPELERALENDFRVAKRNMLHCEVHRNGERVASYEALNDVVITKAALARIIDVECWVDSHFVCRYKADGLIVSTPTGSTAYSLSAGGPILFPQLGAHLITPICPHMLTNRPVIVPDASVIRLYNRAEDEGAYLTVDGQVGEPLRRDDLILCQRSEHAISLIRPPKLLFFDVLRSKLKWGER
ncbi:MAG: NAD(+)/NADH kinase [Bryobacteraceae bacterium]|nr:NAD(+)/NADH kinase [Bryobacteraceae bacterium]